MTTTAGTRPDLKKDNGRDKPGRCYRIVGAPRDQGVATLQAEVLPLSKPSE